MPEQLRAPSARRRRGSRRRASCDARRTVTTNGTGLGEWAVCGLPSGSASRRRCRGRRSRSQPPPVSSTASSTWPRQRSTVSTARVAAGMSPVWPTMSGFAKLMIPKRNGAALRGRRAPARRRTAAAAGSRAHLRLVVVGGDVARRGHEAALLARVRVLLPAVEEVGDVRVLLGLGDVQLALAALRQHRGERDLGPGLLERDRVVPVLLVARHRREVDAAGSRARSNSAKSGSPSARTIWRIRSGRKLNVMTLSPSAQPARARRRSSAG